MPISITILGVVIILIVFGITDRLLDKMGLNDTWALILTALIAIGIFVPTIDMGNVSLSVGGFLIPIGLAIYMLIKVGWSVDLLKAVIGIAVTIGIVFLFNAMLPAEPEELWIDPNIVIGFVVGLLSFFVARSERNAFVSIVFGMFLADLIQYFINVGKGLDEVALGLGTGGVLDATIVALLVAFLSFEFMNFVGDGVTGRDLQTKPKTTTTAKKTTTKKTTKTVAKPKTKSGSNKK